MYLGDLNMPETFSYECLHSVGLTQHVKTPIRIDCCKGKKSILDLIITKNCPPNFAVQEIFVGLDLSNHKIVVAHLLVFPNKGEEGGG